MNMKLKYKFLLLKWITCFHLWVAWNICRVAWWLFLVVLWNQLQPKRNSWQRYTSRPFVIMHKEFDLLLLFNRERSTDIGPIRRRLWWQRDGTAAPEPPASSFTNRLYGHRMDWLVALQCNMRKSLEGKMTTKVPLPFYAFTPKNRYGDVIVILENQGV